MFSLIACVRDQHNQWLVFLAACICVLGAVTFVLLMRRADDCPAEHRGRWLLVAALAGSLGVWSTHFVAMLAYNSVLPLSFEPWRTASSVAYIVICWWVGLLIGFYDRRPASKIICGVLMTVGVALMHYTGMAAIEMPARMRVDIVYGAVGVAIAGVWIVAAKLVRHRRDGKGRIAAPAALLVLGIVTLHFTGMNAVTFEPDPTLAVPETALNREWLTVVVAGTTVLLICGAGFAVLLDRHLTDLKGLINATHDGFMVVQAGRIVQVNEALCKLCGHGAAAMHGKPPQAFLPSLADDLHQQAASQYEGELQCADGTRRIVEIAAHIVEYRGSLCQVISLRDLTEKREAERRIAHMARHDGLTGLPNRHLFDERLKAALARAKRSGRLVAVLALDLDRFKAVNDIFGHAKGDEVLCRVADLLRSIVREGDTVARVGGDEFLVIVDSIVAHEEAETLALRLLDEFGREMDIARNPMAVGVSIGAAVFPEDANEAEALKQHADIALYRAKQTGRGNVSFFAPAMDQEVRARRQLEHDLLQAVQRRQMSVVYQPLVSSGNGEVVGYEAFMRWRHPVLGLIAPEVFIPLAEESGSIVQIGEWVLREACQEAARWHGALRVAVNISSVQLQLPSFADVVATCLEQSGLQAERLELEVTETALLKDKAGVLAILRQLKQLGVRVVMDDFGTGYSSLNNLQSFPFDKIKIDKSFISALEDDEAARSIVRAIVGLGRSLNLSVVAEGVETEAQWRLVVEEGCPEAQGYLFGKPVPARSRMMPLARIASGG